ncbi:MAG TPA: nucleotide exchange factor GrpE [Oscillatoriaceae cyanobacterium]
MTEEELQTQESPAAEPVEASASAETPVESPEAVLEARLAEKEQQYQDLDGQFRRLAADFENYRRRQSQERENLIKFAGERILERFLEVLDNFERALQTGDSADPQQLRKGIELIHRQLQDFLAKEGVAAMEPKGQPFDPNSHEAVVQVDSSDVPDQTVLEEFRKGYTLNGRVLRHAMVKIASNPGMPSAPAQEPAASDAQTDSASQSS